MQFLNKYQWFALVFALYITYFSILYIERNTIDLIFFVIEKATKHYLQDFPEIENSLMTLKFPEVIPHCMYFILQIFWMHSKIEKYLISTTQINSYQIILHFISNDKS